MSGFAVIVLLLRVGVSNHADYNSSTSSYNLSIGSVNCASLSLIGLNMSVRHYIIIDAAFLDTSHLVYERIRQPDCILPCAQIFRSRKAANHRVRELEGTLGYPAGQRYLQVVQVTQPKEFT